MKCYQVIFRREARDDAVEAAVYLAEQGGLEVASRWLSQLEAALDSLSRWPRRCPVAPEAAAFGGVDLRQLGFQSYRILFVIEGEEVQVLHVRHSARGELEAGD